MLQFNFDAQKGETPQSIAQKRALVAQIMGSQRAPSNVGEGLNAIGDGIVANVLGGRAAEAERGGQKSADDTFSQLVASITGQGAPNPSYAPRTASDATAAMAGGGGDFMSGLINSESGGNWGALNKEGYGGRLQFGDARLADAAAAGLVAPGTTGAAFSRMSPEQQQAVEAWHFADIDKQAANMGLNQYFGQTIAGVPINERSVQAMAHLGGVGGAQKFITSGGRYNPADSNGTRLSDYGSRFGGTSGGATPAPTQVASLDPAIGAPQTGAPQQLPPIGPQGGPPMMAQAPVQQQQPAQQVAQGPDLAMLMQAASNPWLSDSQKSIINSMIGQQMQQQDPAYQQGLRAGDLGIQKSELELDALRNPKVDPWSGVKVINDQVVGMGDGGPQVMGDFRSSDLTPLMQNLAAAGLQPGSPEYAQAIIDSVTKPQTQVSVGGNNDIGTIPTGMMVTRDPAGNVTGMVPVPGGPADQAAQAAEAQATAGANQTQRYGNVVIEDIDRAVSAIEKDPSLTTGMIGQWLSGIGGTPANRVNNLLTTVKANAGFDRLQAMRDASPTGGALGAVSEKELALLNSAIGSLEQSNTSEDLTYNLKRVQQIYTEIVNGPEKARQPQPAPGQSQPRQVNSKTEMDALPSGSVFRAPDGSIRVKP